MGITCPARPDVQVMTRNLVIVQEPVAGRRPGNTAGPSGELSRGDLVTVGEAALICERVGWTPLRGGITEVRADEHGTHPLPASHIAPADRQPAGTEPGNHGT